MKLFYLGFLLISLMPSLRLFAQGPPPPMAPESVETIAWTDMQLSELMGPIALYPDALIALILTSATEPAEVVLAARHLASNPRAGSIEDQPWSESVKALARYPEVVSWMDTNLDWTQQAGDAFLSQPADVMNAVQRLRTQARAVGTLTDTPEQRVIVEEQVIRIEPAHVEVIYVPRYDPAVIYFSRPLGLRSSYITFGYPYPAGSWLAYTCDWQYRRILVVNISHHRPFVPSYSYRHNHYRAADFHHWTPPVRRSRSVINRPARSDIARPAVNVVVPRHTVEIVRPKDAERSHSGSRPTQIRPDHSGQRDQRPGGSSTVVSRQPSRSPQLKAPSAPVALAAPVTGYVRPSGPRVQPPALIQKGPANRSVPPIHGYAKRQSSALVESNLLPSSTGDDEQIAKKTKRLR